MAFNFDKLVQGASKAAESAKKTANNLADKGKKKIDLVNAESKLSNAQKQLGALVYSLHVNGEENPALVEKYISNIAEIEAEIEKLKQEDADVAEPAEENDETNAEPKAEATEVPKARFCGQCGSEVAEDALFCNKCGAQL